MGFINILIYGIAIIVFIVIISYIYNHYKTQRVAYYESAYIVEGKHIATSEKMVTGTQIPSPLQGNEYALSMWLYINDYNYRYGLPKHILYRGIEKNGNIEANPEIFLHPTENTLMVRIKLQTETVPDPNSHLIKVTTPDPVSQNNMAINNTQVTGSMNNTPVSEESNVSGNDATGNNTPVVVSENFYTSLGTNVLDSNITLDNMEHNFALVAPDTTCGKLDSLHVQMKEMFQNNNNSVANNNAVNGVNQNKLSNNSMQLMPNNIANEALIDFTPEMVDENFLKSNPFIASFMDKYSNATSPEERQNVANDYARNFVDKSEEDRKVIADQFMKTLARMFAKSMGLKIVEDQEISNSELKELQKQNELYDTCYVRNVPLQKWTNISVSVFQNTCDIYLDGKLTSSCNLKGFPQPNKNNVIITPKDGFNGYIANTQFYNMAFTPEKAMNIYQAGPEYSQGFFKSLWNKTTGK
jgi:hypothetical protein